jgi:hypothetical protein
LHSIPKNEIEQQKTINVSVMPDVRELLTAQEVADLVAYLQNISSAEVVEGEAGES